MKVVVAIDSFKGSVTSMEAGEAIRDGIYRMMPEAEVVVKPLADGGEGTVEALISGMNGTEHRVMVTGPMGQPVEAVYGIVEGKTAVMEMAKAAGITLIHDKCPGMPGHLVPPMEKNPWEAGTFGVGEMIKDAIEKGCRTFILGIGGSATNDGGMGMLKALGYGFYDKEGKELSPKAKELIRIAQISDASILPELFECSFRIACDVTNPLCGKNGASFVFGPQKGADESMVQNLDEGLSHFAEITSELFGEDVSMQPGTGAAGGMGYACLAYLKGALEPGIQIVLDTISFEEELKTADMVITGEGRLDAQTVMGKAPIGVAKLAKKYDCKVIALAGSVAEDARICNEHGIDGFFSILQRVKTLEEAMDKEETKRNIRDTAAQIFGVVRGFVK